MPSDELEFVEWLKSRCPAHSALKLGIGDDMAALDLRGGRILASCDVLLDGVHFDLQKHTYAEIGRKALACSLSDCAAMAVQPRAVTVSVALPQSSSLEDAKEIYEGLLKLAKEFEVAIAGGDTARWRHPLAIDIAIVAEPYPGIEPVTRSGARPGDRLFVTGPLGGSILGHHMNFVPRVTEARRLAEELGDGLHAMMDVSDGLSLDLWRMCQASRAGAELDEALVSKVIADDARRLAKRDGRTPLEHALSDGEDFELLLAVADDLAPTSVPTFAVGRVVADGFSIRRPDGTIEPLQPQGFVH